MAVMFVGSATYEMCAIVWFVACSQRSSEHDEQPLSDKGKPAARLGRKATDQRWR
jgi:hypothetical protein